MRGDRDWWFDDAAGPMVRPYALTSGRTRPGAANLNLVTQISAAASSSDASTLTPEQREILDLCAAPLSVAEIAAYLDVPLMVVKVLISDLIERGDAMAGAMFQTSDIADPNFLQAVLDGIRRI